MNQRTPVQVVAVRFSIFHFSFLIAESRIQIGTTTVGFAFAPAERDVYSYELTRNVFAPLGAKPASGTTAEQAKGITLLRSKGVKKESPGYKHLAPLGRRHKQRSVALRN